MSAINKFGLGGGREEDLRNEPRTVKGLYGHALDEVREEKFPALCFARFTCAGRPSGARERAMFQDPCGYTFLAIGATTLCGCPRCDDSAADMDGLVTSAEFLSRFPDPASLVLYSCSGETDDGFHAVSEDEDACSAVFLGADLGERAHCSWCARKDSAHSEGPLSPDGREFFQILRDWRQDAAASTRNPASRSVFKRLARLARPPSSTRVGPGPDAQRGGR